MDITENVSKTESVFAIWDSTINKSVQFNIILAVKAIFLEKTLEAIKYNAIQLNKENKHEINLYFQILLYFLKVSLSIAFSENMLTEKACNQYIPIGFLLL